MAELGQGGFGALDRCGPETARGSGIAAVAISVLVDGGDGAGDAQRSLGRPIRRDRLAQTGEQGACVVDQRCQVLEVDGNLGPQPARPMRLDQIANATCQRVEWHGTDAIAAVAVGA